MTVDPAILKLLNAEARDVKFKARGSGFSSVGELFLHNKKYFLKCSRSRDMIEGEAESYRHIQDAVPEFCPGVVGSGACDLSSQYFVVTTFLDFSTPSRPLAESLSTLHAKSSENGKYGFPCATCCADTVQDNSWNDSWTSFFVDQRMKPIARLSTNASDAELQKLVQMASETAIPHLLNNLKIRPSLIHGDLWSGNQRNGTVYDSCALYAHSEFELSIMRMFGGFDSEIRQYHELRPKDKPESEYDDRQRLYMCYHQLNHSGTGQGSSYKDAAKRTLRDLIERYS